MLMLSSSAKNKLSDKKSLKKHSYPENFVKFFFTIISKTPVFRNFYILGIDSRIVRNKISSELIRVLKQEMDWPQSWHLKYRSVIPRADFVYLAYDPQDARLATSIKENLSQRGLQVQLYFAFNLITTKCGTDAKVFCFVCQNFCIVSHLK